MTGLPSLILFGLFWSGAAAQALAGGPSLPAGFSEIYLRATNRFANVQLFKPRELEKENLGFTLAPLILQEVSHGTAQARIDDPFGALEPAAAGVRVEPSKPTLYFQPDIAMLNGKPHPTMTYLWFYPAGQSKTRPRAVSVQGIRLTLDNSGRPAIWEVLADPSRADIIFVSKSVEAAALIQYGGPLPGRHFSVERKVAEAQKVIVARVIEDGPVPMGPILYLRSPSHAVSTLICRCMPAQAAQVTQSVYYDLADEASIAQFLGKSAGPSSGEIPRFQTFNRNAADLEKRLRLPASF